MNLVHSILLLEDRLRYFITKWEWPDFLGYFCLILKVFIRSKHHYKSFPTFSFCLPTGNIYRLQPLPSSSALYYWAKRKIAARLLYLLKGKIQFIKFRVMSCFLFRVCLKYFSPNPPPTPIHGLGLRPVPTSCLSPSASNASVVKLLSTGLRFSALQYFYIREINICRLAS
jgi:hypothetical protein